MRRDCPWCRAVLEYSSKPPSFCPDCGHDLRPVAPDSTATFDPSAPSAVPTAGPDGSLEGQEVGGYRLLRTLGAGAMGTVYEAEARATGRRVAVKLIGAPFGASEQAVERFRREGRLASLIAHPRCVFVLAAEEEAGRPYIVMELMPGRTLKDLVEEQGPLPPEQAVARILDVIEGLQEAHRLQVIHRDVKPSNCFLEADGRVKIGDFGISKSLVGDAHLTQTGSFMGTPHFAAPEQHKGENIDFRSDVYAVAATLYYLLTGKPPFHQCDSVAAVAARKASEAPPSLRSLCPELSRRLDQVVLRGLERHRERRWRNLDELRTALLPFVPGHLSIGGLGLRATAFLLDLVLLFLAGAVYTALAGHPPDESAWNELLNTIEQVVLGIGYFALLEGVWGCSLGKRLFRLRVYTGGAAEAPGVARALLRAFLLETTLNLGWVVADILALAYLPDHPGAEGWVDLLPWLWVAGGLALLTCTMRAGNGYRGLHELFSGTRVGQLPWPEKRRPLRTQPPRPEAASPDRLPGRIGPFVIRGAMAWGAGEKVLLGEDESLGRTVWIWLRPAGVAPVAPERRQVSRLTRLRWLASGQHGNESWDAFLAPPGGPLVELIAREGRLSWPDVRPLLEQLCDELASASQDGTLPGRLTISQVWVEPNGRVQLLDTPLGAEPAAGSALQESADPERPLCLLRQFAILTLEGSPRPPAGVPPSIRAPVPGHAAEMLDRLLAIQAPYRQAEQMRADLAATRDRPKQVNRVMRAGHLAWLVALLFPGLVILTALVPAVMVMRAEADRKSRAPAEASDLVLTEEEYRQGALASSTVSAALLLLWVVWAGLFRGGWTLRLMGMALVRSDGRKASRWQCAGRALLVWGPGLALYAAILWLGAGADELPPFQRFLVSGTIGFVALLLLLGLDLVLALVFPRRSPHDLLVGTCLVPR